MHIPTLGLALAVVSAVAAEPLSIPLVHNRNFQEIRSDPAALHAWSEREVTRLHAKYGWAPVARGEKRSKRATASPATNGSMVSSGSGLVQTINVGPDSSYLGVMGIGTPPVAYNVSSQFHVLVTSLSSMLSSYRSY